ncbi:hypothetical protein [Streptomyces sp. C8S0]|uniref:hypothetical protein n=1 Tax=Streptomyces sp. C8S0 TaxID=2585716 RepID=UPI001D0484E6|nr:hypothetical protein [Streptomyces sp. C8S0]
MHLDRPGAQDAARALLVGILTAAERQRPGQARVTAAVPQEIAQTLLPGLPPHFSALTQFAHTADAIRAAEQHLLRHAHAHDTLVPTPGSTQPEAPGTLVLLTASDAEHSGQLQALAARAKLGTLVVLTLDSPLSSAASWRIDTDGTTRSDTGHHDDLVLFHLTLDASRDVTNVLLTAHGQTPNRTAPSSHPRA